MIQHLKNGLAGRNLHRTPLGQTLLIDADDTLWENNLYFEQAIAGYISFLDQRTHSPAEVREHLNLTERETIAANGYGLKSFRASLTRCLEDLLLTSATPQQHESIAGFVDHIGNHPIELLRDVAETLGTLASRHRVILVTKGDPVEQLAKLASSGLAPHFAATEVLAEKHESAYRDVIERHSLDPGQTWMIGNSPKSDINPALLAGLNAVLIPHEHTWILEHEPVASAPSGRTLLQLSTFAVLATYF